jgi:glucokinase
MRIGIDIGGMSVKGGLIDKDNKIIARVTRKTLAGDVSNLIADEVSKIIDELCEKSGFTTSEIEFCGIGSPGAINPAEGIIKYSNNIVMHNVPIVSQLSARYPFPIKIDNDANCAALGEAYFGGGKGHNDVILITLGTGVGSGIIVDKKLFTGGGGAGAEAGHMVIVADGGLECNCGLAGCWEKYASATALVNQTSAAMQKNPHSLMHNELKDCGSVSGRTAFNAAAKGDAAAVLVVDKYLGYIATGIINLSNIFRPQVVVIGGGVSNEGQSILAPIQKKVDAGLYGGSINPKVTIALATLGNDAGILGAAYL